LKGQRKDLDKVGEALDGSWILFTDLEGLEIKEKLSRWPTKDKRLDVSRELSCLVDVQ